MVFETLTVSEDDDDSVELHANKPQNKTLNASTIRDILPPRVILTEEFRSFIFDLNEK